MPYDATVPAARGPARPNPTSNPPATPDRAFPLPDHVSARPGPPPARPDHSPASRPGQAAITTEIVELIDRLVDAIDVRESFEPDSASWAAGPTIQDIERELALRWGFVRGRDDAGSGHGFSL